jgi:hypothetical protein
MWLLGATFALGRPLAADAASPRAAVLPTDALDPQPRDLGHGRRGQDVDVKQLASHLKKLKDLKANPDKFDKRPS